MRPIICWPIGYCKFAWGCEPRWSNPSWMEFINVPLRTYTGVEGISFWSFMIGGNLLGLLFSVMLYPVVKHMCCSDV